jgi:two-component system phosphate regulon response regulator PhoB
LHPRQVFTRQQLMEAVWQTTEWLGEATVTEHVHRLRAKLGKDLPTPLIRTVRGVGYQFDVSSVRST